MKTLRLFYLALAFGLFARAAPAADFEIKTDSAGRKILADKNSGEEIVLRLHQSSLSSRVLQFSPIGPDYTLTVYAKGNVVFHGTLGVKTVGDASHRLGESQIKELLQLLRGPDVVALGEDGREVFWYATLIVSIDGAVHEIALGDANYQSYAKLRSDLEPYLHSLQYRCPLQGKDRENTALNEMGVCENAFEFEKYFKQ